MTHDYVSNDHAREFQKQAFRVWMVGAIVVLLWVTAILVAPLARATGAIVVATPLYSFFGFFCHQISDRSFHVFGEQFGVCSRCFGVYFGLLLGFAIYPMWHPIADVNPPARFWLFLSIIPITVDWSLTMFGVWGNTHLSRLLTGMLLGIACATFIIPALVEITRNLSRQRVVT
ncbi:MAG: DUF2085 domain-containing protein [Pyrinomonadaceae bacterium]